MSKAALLLYAPVIHQGLLTLIERRSSEITTIYVIGDLLVTNVPRAERDFRIPSGVIVRGLQAMLPKHDIQELSEVTKELHALHLIANDHIVVRHTIETQFPKSKVTWDHTFVRWDLPAVMKEVPVDVDFTVSNDELFKNWLSQAKEIAKKESPNFFRQVGGFLVKDGKILLGGHNTHGHFTDADYWLGNPRVWIDGGHPEIDLDIHGEQSVLLEAARRGIATEGCDIITTTFPCTTCANLICQAGIARVIFSDGYSHGNGQKVLKDHGVQLIRVEA